ncbi:MAG: hypothetical protein C4539_09405 [Ignavibacteriales bacterium]|nr:MAG: hypothetical protein C4539_09405 [Ignavibacteriales bacterium]
MVISSNKIRLILSENYPLLLPVFIYLVQFFLFLDKRVLYDENWVAVPVYNFWGTKGFWVTAVLDGGLPTTVYQFTFYQLLLLGFHLIVPKEIILSRLVNLFIVVAIFIVLYILSKRIFKNKYWAILPVLILSTDNIFFISSYIVRPDIFLGIGIILTVLLLYDKEFQFRSGKILLIGFLSFVLAGFHPNYILAIISFIIVYTGFERHKFTTIENLKTGLKFFLVPITGVILISALIIFTQGNSDFNFWKYLYAYLDKTTTFNNEGAIFHPLKLITEESRRYSEFISFPYRVHIFILSAFAIFFGLFQHKKVIRILSLLTILVLFSFFLFIWNKNVRYLSLVLPTVSILISFMFYWFYNGWNNLRGKLILLFISLILLSLLVGNILLIKSRWNTSYPEMKSALQFKINKEDVIIGDLVLWDFYRDANYISYMSDIKSILSHKYDYVILGGKKTIQDKNRNYFEDRIFPKLNSRLIKVYDNPYYGNFRLYKVNR